MHNSFSLGRATGSLDMKRASGPQRLGGAFGET
jgi:hypothetical protein